MHYTAPNSRWSRPGDGETRGRVCMGEQEATLAGQIERTSRIDAHGMATSR